MAEKAKNKGGRPRFQPTEEHRKMVETAAGFFLKDDQIALLVPEGISESTLKRYFKAELRRGRARVKYAIGAALYKGVNDGVPALVIFACKTQLGMREVDRHELTGADGAPLGGSGMGVIIVPGIQSEEEWQEHTAKYYAKMAAANAAAVTAITNAAAPTGGVNVGTASR